MSDHLEFVKNGFYINLFFKEQNKHNNIRKCSDGINYKIKTR